MKTTMKRGVLAGVVLALSCAGQATAYVPPSTACQVDGQETVTREADRTVYWICDGTAWRAWSVCIDNGHCELIFG